MTKTESTVPLDRLSKRVASIDWMRDLVMDMMVIDHASMTFDRYHLNHDSAMYADTSVMVLPGPEFLPRWLAHLCAASFVSWVRPSS